MGASNLNKGNLYTKIRPTPPGSRRAPPTFAEIFSEPRKIDRCRLSGRGGAMLVSLAPHEPPCDVERAHPRASFQ
jgi:hypothetical protein